MATLYLKPVGRSIGTSPRKRGDYEVDSLLKGLSIDGKTGQTDPKPNEEGRLIPLLYIFLLLVRASCALLLPGYVHPDEHFQSVEIVAGSCANGCSNTHVLNQLIYMPVFDALQGIFWDSIPFERGNSIRERQFVPWGLCELSMSLRKKLKRADLILYIQICCFGTFLCGSVGLECHTGLFRDLHASGRTRGLFTFPAGLLSFVAHHRCVCRL